MKKICLFITALGFLFSQNAFSVGKVQQQGFKIQAECLAAGATLANCLLLTAQIWDSVNLQPLSSTIANHINPTTQKFLSGSGTYTTPTSPSPKYIEIKISGGGGGAASSSSGGTGSGGTGGTTTFGSSILTALGGGGASVVGSGYGGTGGTFTVAGGALDIGSTAGGSGGSGTSLNSGTGAGGNGGSNCFGGAGGGGGNMGATPAGTNAAANSGAGGGGGSRTGVNDHSGGGGGSGACIHAIINSPAASYSYSIGVAGAPDVSNDNNAGLSAAGVLYVIEYY